MIAYLNHLLNAFPCFFYCLAINKLWPGD